MVWGAAVISVELFLLAGHRPSDRADELVEFYLSNADGVRVSRTHIISTAHLVDILRRQKIADLPAMKVPTTPYKGAWSANARQYTTMLVGVNDIEKWCKENA